MSNRLEKLTATVGKPMPVDLERQQRASAPTLRDLLAAAEPTASSSSASKVYGGQSGTGSRMKNP